MSARDTLAVLAEEIGNALLPLREAVSDPENFVAFMSELGWEFDSVPTFFKDLGNTVDEIENHLESGGIDASNFDDIASAIKALLQGIVDIKNQPIGTFPPTVDAIAFKNDFPQQLLDSLIGEYLLDHWPAIGPVFQALGIIRLTPVDAEGLRLAYLKKTIAWNEISQLIDDPFIVIKNAFNWGSMDFRTEYFAETMFNLADGLGIEVVQDVLNEKLEDFLTRGATDATHAYVLKFPLIEGDFADTDGEMGVGLFMLPATLSDKPGFSLLPYIEGSNFQEINVTDELSVSIVGQVDFTTGVGIMIRPDKKAEVFSDIIPSETNGLAPPTTGNLTLSLTNEGDGREKLIVVGSSEGSRFEMTRISLKGGTRIDPAGKNDVFIELNLNDANIVIQPAKDADSFLRSILPEEGFVIDFSLLLGFSASLGFYFNDSSGLEVRLPAHIEVGLIEVSSSNLRIKSSSGNISVEIGTTIKGELGPLSTVVENLGFKAVFSFSDDNAGNLGPIDLSLGFKPPNSLGLTINGGGFKGGGFLDFEEDKQRYVGFLELEFKKKISLKAIGFLTTSLPDGSEGYSLLIIITAEFNPIQLGYGFTLNGVGGLLGLNRTANVERLRTGIKDNTLSSVLFPKDIVANAGRIISDLRQVFPAQQDRFIFGPMAKIGWGTPTLITIDLGLMIEVPSPVRLLILGVVLVQIPNEEERKKQEEDEGREIPRILQLQVNFLGEVDFDAQRLAFDASLYDSRLLIFPLTGDMALRFSWGSDPNFLLSVGGFHPAYEPPPLALPNLQRLTFPLLSGDNLRLNLEMYFAITSNTVQFGARVELYAVKSKFNVSGFLSLDVLFQSNPVYFIADIGAMLALRIGSRSIASINLALTLEGPTPWHAKGTAKLKICWFFTLKVRFNKTFGKESDTRLDDVPVLPLLQAALSNQGNWEAQLPSGRHALVSVKEIKVGNNEIVVDPSGVLTINQKVVPLNITIQKFGNQLPADARHFAIEQVRVGSSNDTELFATAATQESFAPAQFFDKTDAQKLASKSFEHYDSGVKLSQSEQMTANYAARRLVEYELFYIDKQRDQRLQRWFDLILPDPQAFNTLSSRGAIANSPLSYTSRVKSALAPDTVQFNQEQFAVVNISDLRPFNEKSMVASEAGAYSLMNEMILDNSALEGELQVVPTFEMNRVNRP